MEETFRYIISSRKKKKVSYWKFREKHVHHNINYNRWLEDYSDMRFFKLFRMQKSTFYTLLNTLMTSGYGHFIRKSYRGGNHPVEPEKGLLVFLWYMSKQDTLLSIAEHFSLVPSTVMNLVNIFLYVVMRLKNRYIFWPKTREECQHIAAGFERYPNTIGAVDGSHVDIKVPVSQQDSYCNRYQSHSINLMGICTAEKLFIYVFVGFPGSAHDSRVFSNSLLFRNIERLGPNLYFPEDHHLIGDSAFPLRTWLMKPFPRGANFNRVQSYHNNCLSSARVCIENTFGILKGRWARLQYINTYSVSKAIEITTAACVLHNFCYLNHDEWPDPVEEDNDEEEEYLENDREAYRLGNIKRNAIANQLFLRDR